MKEGRVVRVWRNPAKFKCTLDIPTEKMKHEKEEPYGNEEHRKAFPKPNSPWVYMKHMNIPAGFVGDDLYNYGIYSYVKKVMDN